MTRFARYGQGNKRVQEAAQWTEMKTGESTSPPVENSSPPAVNSSPPVENSSPPAVNSGQGKIEPSPSNKQNSSQSPLKGVRNNTSFKQSNNKNKINVSKGNTNIHIGGRKFNKGDKKDFRQLECYNCHKKGHKVSDCPEPSDGKQLEVQCYNCKEKGHKAFKCPLAPQQEHRKKFVKVDRKQKVDWKAERSEHRRNKRQDDTQFKLHCYNCRETGHKLSDCPEIQKDVEHGTGICFKCGSTEHTAKRCSMKLAPGEYPYAKCFICGETGHLSQKCPDNPRGLYPNGGGCRECGSVEHLMKDCPEFQKQQGIGSVTLERIGVAASMDQEESHMEKTLPKIEPISKRAKLVKF